MTQSSKAFRYLMGITSSGISGLRLSYHSAENGGDDDANLRGAESSARMVCKQHHAMAWSFDTLWGPAARCGSCTGFGLLLSQSSNLTSNLWTVLASDGSICIPNEYLLCRSLH